MWRALWTRLSLRSRRRISDSTTLRFRARLPEPVESPASIPSSAIDEGATRDPLAQRPPRQIHRQKVLAMQLAHTRLCSPSRARRLADLGIITCEDLCRADLENVAGKFRARSRARTTLKLYRRSIRLATSVDGLSPIDALALVSIHRRTVASLATQNAAMLHRDLARFAESSAGRALLRGRRLPSLKRLRRWITFSQRVANASVTPHRSMVAMPTSAGVRIAS